METVAEEGEHALIPQSARVVVPINQNAGVIGHLIQHSNILSHKGR